MGPEVSVISFLSILCYICWLGLLLNVLVAVPYYHFVLRPHAKTDEERFHERLGTCAIAAVPWLHVLLIVVILVGGFLLWLRSDKKGPGESQEKDGAR